MVTYVKCKGGMVIPVAMDETTVETVVRADINEIDVTTSKGEASSYADIGKIPCVGAAEIANVSIPDKASVEADNGAVHVF